MTATLQDSGCHAPYNQFKTSIIISCLYEHLLSMYWCLAKTYKMHHSLKWQNFFFFRVTAYLFRIFVNVFNIQHNT